MKNNQHIHHKNSKRQFLRGLTPLQAVEKSKQGLDNILQKL